jgi:hypothetical protein
MNLDVLRAQMLNIEEEIEKLMEAERKAQEIKVKERPSGVVKRKHNASVNITEEEFRQFAETLHKYLSHFEHTRHVSQSAFMRILIRHFLDNWQILPMREAWITETALAFERKSLSATGRNNPKRRGEFVR